MLLFTSHVSHPWKSYVTPVCFRLSAGLSALSLCFTSCWYFMALYGSMTLKNCKTYRNEKNTTLLQNVVRESEPIWIEKVAPSLNDLTENGALSAQILIYYLPNLIIEWSWIDSGSRWSYLKLWEISIRVKSDKKRVQRLRVQRFHFKFQMLRN